MPQAQPLFFGPPQRPLFGWLHQPEPRNACDVGLLICAPLGYDAISSHRTLRHLAEASAALGIPALRFDYDGTGDSAGQDTDPARVEAWLDSIQIAAATLREQAGIRHLYLFGIRLGASLALLAAQSLPETAGVILVNPVVEGRRYLRELRALAATSAVAAADATAIDTDIQEAAGFITTAETRQAVNAMRLAGESVKRAPRRALLLERTDLPADNGLPGHLQQLGGDVMRVPFPGYADMLRDAHETIVPEDMLRGVLEWMQEAPSVPASPTTTRRTDSCEFTWDTGEDSKRLRETTIRFGAGDSVFGILTERAPSTGSGVVNPSVMLLLNSGAVHHIGPNRLYVRIARLLAMRGVSVLRFDLPGLGDSPAPAGRDENQTYPDWAVPVVCQALDYIKTRHPGSVVHSAGICSGAYHSLKAAVAGAALQSIFVINPLTFFWKSGMSLAVAAYQDTAEMMRYRRTGFSAASLRKLLSGSIDLRNLAGVLRRSALRRLHHTARNLGRRLGLTLQDDLVTELRMVQSQGTKMRFIFASTDPGHSMLREQGGSEVGHLLETGALTIDFIDQADHTFTPRAAQQNLLSLLARLADSSTGPAE